MICKRKRKYITIYGSRDIAKINNIIRKNKKAANKLTAKPKSLKKLKKIKRPKGVKKIQIVYY